MEPEGSLPYSQVPATCPYPKPTPSSPHHPLKLPENYCYYLVIRPRGSFQCPTDFWNHDSFEGVRQDSLDGVSMVPGGVIKAPFVSNSVSHLTASESDDLGFFPCRWRSAL
jgi:hypothetical protein